MKRRREHAKLTTTHEFYNLLTSFRKIVSRLPKKRKEEGKKKGRFTPITTPEKTSRLSGFGCKGRKLLLQKGVKEKEKKREGICVGTPAGKRGPFVFVAKKKRSNAAARHKGKRKKRDAKSALRATGKKKKEVKQGARGFCGRGEKRQARATDAVKGKGKRKKKRTRSRRPTVF